MHNPDLNYKEYEKYFNGTNTRQYAINPEFMNSCMEDKTLLVERLKSYTLAELKGYFGVKDTNMELKQQCYNNFLMATCLYEVFVMEFLGDEPLKKAIGAWEKVGQKVQLLHVVTQKLEEKTEICRQPEFEEASEEEKKLKQGELIADIQNVQVLVEQQTVLLQEAGMLTEKALYYVGHCKHLTAFAAIITMIETENINEGIEVAAKVKWKELSKGLDAGFGEEAQYLFMQEVKGSKAIVLPK